jgi:hypothetical protein
MAKMDAAMNIRQVVLMPILESKDLSIPSKVKEFVKNMKAYLLTNKKRFMYEGIAGDCWRVLTTWCAGIEPEEDSEGLIRYRPEEDLLAECLLALYQTGDVEGARAIFDKLRMATSEGNVVSLEAAVGYTVSWTNQLEMTKADDRPGVKELIQLFLKNISHGPLKAKLSTYYKSLSSAEKDDWDLDMMINLFAREAREMAEISAKHKLFTKKANSSSEMDTMIQAAVSKALNASVVSDSGDASSSSRGAKRRRALSAKKQGDTKKFVAIPDAEKKCYGCGHKGHGRDKCDNKDHPGFVKAPGKCAKPLKL